MTALCLSQALLVNAKAFQDLALTPLHDADTARIITFTKPISTLAFRFITRPLLFVTCPFFTQPILGVSLPLQCLAVHRNAFASLHFVIPYFSFATLIQAPTVCRTTLLSLNTSFPSQNETCQITAKAFQITASTKHFGSLPFQDASIRHHYRSKHFHYASCHSLFGSEHVPFVSVLIPDSVIRCSSFPKLFVSEQNLCFAICYISLSVLTKPFLCDTQLCLYWSHQS